jgi:hypothetical protein
MKNENIHKQQTTTKQFDTFTHKAFLGMQQSKEN